MLNQLRPALVLLVGLTLLTGLAYPLAITGVSQLLFPNQAEGSLVRHDGKVIGSALIGQAFTSDRYFQPRPSAAGAWGAPFSSRFAPACRSKSLFWSVTMPIRTPVSARKVASFM